MFQEYLRSRPKEPRLSAAKLVAVAVSGVLHIILIYALYHGKMTIRMISAFGDLQNVVISPALRGKGPVIMGSGVSESGGSASGTEGRTGRLEGRPEAEAGNEPAPSPPSSPLLSRSFSLRREADGTPIPALSKEFYESLLKRTRPRTKSGLIITFAPPGVKPAPPLKVDLREHLFPVQPGLPEESRASRASRGVLGGQRAGITIPLQGYDLAPWAEQVIAIIHRNWELPLIKSLPPRSTVKILTMITRSGSLSSFELLISSSVVSLDQAAVRAIRSSLPFPPLPADFPADLLEAYFEFTYNE